MWTKWGFLIAIAALAGGGVVWIVAQDRPASEIPQDEVSAENAAEEPEPASAPIDDPVIVERIEKEPGLGFGKKSSGVTDGDTIRIGDIVIRLFGIDAPEWEQMCWNGEEQYACGQEARAFVEWYAGGLELRPLYCDLTAERSYGRRIGICYVADDKGAMRDLGAWLVEEGKAVAYRRYSNRYVALEEKAKAEKKGLWRGEFMMPEEWRKKNKQFLKDADQIE